ncbi:MAG: SBBP repeat-containing protein, partial [Chloroflexi bacterium]|nr:SBBP repeat-containing protein [Chloroflexota bacterium]
MRRSYGLAAILLAVLAIAPAGRRFLPASAAVPGGLRGSPLRAFSRLPLSFEPNRGQAPGPVRFLARGPGYPPGATLYLTATGAVLGSFRIRYVSANPHPRIVAMDRLPSRVNYFLGDDPRRWRRDIPTYGRVLYRGLYAGVDLAYDGRRGHLEYDWLLRPGVDPGRIRLVVEDAGPDAARSRSLRVDTRGDLVLRDGTTSLLQERPIVYQQVGSRRRVIPARYSITGPHQIGVTVGRYDVHRSLAIDPTLVYSTYLGGSDGEGATDIAVDPSGNAYITGDTFSLDFPTRDPQRGALVSDATCRTITGQPSGTCTDAFVSKLSPDGQRLLYSTFLGGSRDDYGHGIALDKAGDAYVVGTTLSTDFPAVHAVQSHFGGGSVLGDAFVAELAPAGNRLMYSTYLGGSGDDDGADIAVAGGKVFVTGRTNSANFPVASSHGQPALQPHRGGGTCRYDFQGSRSVPCYDAFVAELDVRSKGLVYSTYLGGSKSDFGWGIAVHAGSAYVVGQTSSGDFPTRGPGGRALQPAIGGGTCATTGSPEPCSDAFIA